MNYEDLITKYSEKTYKTLQKSFNRNNYNFPNYRYEHIIRNLSSNPLITLKFIDDHPEIYWYWYDITDNPNLTLDFVIKYIDKPWNWDKKGLSCKRIINNDFLINYSNKCWNWYTLSENSAIHINEELLEKFIDKPWDWHILSNHPNISCNFIDNHLNICWSWYRVSENPNITYEFVCKHYAKTLNWYYIINHSPIKFIDLIDFVSKYIEILDARPDSILNMITSHNDITWDIITKYPNINWNWSWLSRNPNISWSIIENNPDKPWVWDAVSDNPSITLDIILNNPDIKWNWNKITNKLSKISTVYRSKWIIDERHKIIASNRIHRFWRDVSFDPKYAYARKKILELYDN